MNAALSFGLWLNILVVQQTYQQTFPSPPSPFYSEQIFIQLACDLGIFTSRFGNLSTILKFECENKTEKVLNSILYSMYQLGKALICWSTYRILFSDLTITIELEVTGLVALL